MNSIGTPAATEGENESREDRFVFSVTIPSLQTISSFQVALSVWHSCILRSNWSVDFDRKNDSHDEVAYAFRHDHDYSNRCYRMIDSLKLPWLIKRPLKNCLKQIFKETKQWINSQRLFPSSFSGVRSQFLIPNFLVWLPNGRIDYKNTAAKICRSSVLTEERKFITMCQYCLVDQIEKFPKPWMPCVLLTKNVPRIQCHLVYYWKCFLTDSSCELSPDDFSCVEAAIAAECGDSDTWSAFEYFWDRLSEEDQISLAIRKLSTGDCEISIQRRILGKMSWYQQRVLLDEIPEWIIFEFLNSSYSSKGVLWAWKHSKDRMTYVQFIDLISLLKEGNESERFLVLIWDTIPDHLRSAVIEIAKKQLSVVFEVIKPSSIHFSLLCKYYPEESEDFWKNLIFNNVPQFANYAEDPTTMHEFVKLCLPDADDLSKFKKSLAKDDRMEYSCQRLFAGGNLEYVDLKLQFCSSNVKAAREYKRNLLMRIKVTEKVIYFTDVEKWRELSAFIDDAFAGKPSMAASRKKMYISLYAKSWPHKYDSTDHGCEEMGKVVEMAYAGDKEGLKRIKNTFLQTILRLPRNENSRWCRKFACEWFLRNFVFSWCLNGDEKAIYNFKNISGYFF